MWRSRSRQRQRQQHNNKSSATATKRVRQDSRPATAPRRCRLGGCLCLFDLVFNFPRAMDRIGRPHSRFFIRNGPVGEDRATGLELGAGRAGKSTSCTTFSTISIDAVSFVENTMTTFIFYVTKRGRSSPKNCNKTTYLAYSRRSITA